MANRALKLLGISLTNRLIGMLEVFELTIQSSRIVSSRRLYSAFLMSSRSTTASIIQSHAPSLAKSPSIVPVVICPAFFLCINCGGSDAINRSMAFSAGVLSSPSRASRSSRRTSRPAFAICAAMPLPIVPAPMTAIFSNCFMPLFLIFMFWRYLPRNSRTESLITIGHSAGRKCPA